MNLEVLDLSGPQMAATTTAIPEMISPPQDQYVMSRSVRTVREAWTEWYSGLAGGPSVVSLDEKYGSRWRSAATERRWYCNRRFVINAIQHQIEQHRMTELEAINLFELKRGTRSMDSLMKELKREHQASSLSTIPRESSTGLEPCTETGEDRQEATTRKRTAPSEAPGAPARRRR